MGGYCGTSEYGLTAPPHPAPPQVSSTLDAEFLDVYQSTHGVIFIFDICKKWYVVAATAARA